jgi:hypothetical protein
MLADLQLVVVDNASEDGSADAIEKEFPEIKLIRNAANRGFAAACNQGILSSDGDLVLLLNSDTEIFDQSLDIVLDFLSKNKEIGLAGGAMLGADMIPQNSCQPFPTYSNLIFSKKSLLTGLNSVRNKFREFRKVPDVVTDVDALAGGFLFIRRDVLDRIGLLDERFFFYVEDIDLAKRVWADGWRVTYIPQARVIHIGGTSVASHPEKTYWWHHRSLYRYFMKYRPNLRPLNWILGFGLVLHYIIWLALRKFGVALKKGMR